MHDTSILSLLSPLRHRNTMPPHAFVFLVPYTERDELGARPLCASSGIVFGSDWRRPMGTEKKINFSYDVCISMKSAKLPHAERKQMRAMTLASDTPHIVGSTNNLEQRHSVMSNNVLVDLDRKFTVQKLISPHSHCRRRWNQQRILCGSSLSPSSHPFSPRPLESLLLGVCGRLSSLASLVLPPQTGVRQQSRSMWERVRRRGPIC